MLDKMHEMWNTAFNSGEVWASPLDVSCYLHRLLVGFHLIIVRQMHLFHLLRCEFIGADEHTV